MKVQEIKKYFVLFYMFGFLAGILSANFIAGEYLADLGIFHEFFMEQYMQTPIDNSEYFWYLLRLRITPLVILGLAGCTKFRKAAVLLFLMWTGLLSGLILTVAVMQRGFGGILLCLVGVLPQLPLYTAGYLILLWFLFCYPKRTWSAVKTICFFLFMAVGLIFIIYLRKEAAALVVVLGSCAASFSCGIIFVNWKTEDNNANKKGKRRKY